MKYLILFIVGLLGCSATGVDNISGTYSGTTSASIINWDDVGNILVGPPKVGAAVMEIDRLAGFGWRFYYRGMKSDLIEFDKGSGFFIGSIKKVSYSGTLVGDTINLVITSMTDKGVELRKTVVKKNKKLR